VLRVALLIVVPVRGAVVVRGAEDVRPAEPVVAAKTGPSRKSPAASRRAAWTQEKGDVMAGEFGGSGMGAAAQRTPRVPRVMLVLVAWVLDEARVLSGSTCCEVVVRALELWKRLRSIASTCFTSPFSSV
jgi:hypothetical protein